MADTLTEAQALDQAIVELGHLEESGGTQRVRFDGLEEWIRLEIGRDERGAFVSATPGGSPINESNARRIENQLRHAKLYYLLDERRFIAQGLHSINRGRLADVVMQRGRQLLEGSGDEGASDETSESEVETEDTAAE